MSYKILDCTLRDGGYYNNWNFPRNLVEKYLESVSQAGVDIVEIGFRFLPANKFMGPYAYSTDDYLKTLKIPSNLQIAVMINGKDYIKESSEKTTELIHKYFKQSNESVVDIVRVAIQFSEVERIQNVLRTLKNLGYKVVLNLMQIGTKTNNEIKQAVEHLSKDSCIDVLYFADSLGNMKVKHIKKTISLIKENWNGDTGIHTHNNLGQGLENSLFAVEEGVSWIDATILGMGRGAGNTKLEYLLIELAKTNKKFKPEALFSLVFDDFKVLQDKYSWGENLAYYLAAEYKIHPTFIQELITNASFDSNDLITSLNSLKESDSTSYNSESLQSSLNSLREGVDGTWSTSKLASGMNFLLLANGPSVKNYSEDIKEYIKNKKPYVVSLNFNETISDEFIDSYALCNPTRMATELETLKKINKPIIIPLKACTEIVRKALEKKVVYDYGIKVIKDTFKTSENTCILPKPVVLPYALSIAISSGATNIYLAGFDGYSAGDRRAQEVESILECVKKNIPSEIKLKSLTPTLYNIEQSSIYSPELR